MRSLKPCFYNVFSCLCNECPYTCCMDWGVHFSKDEVERLHGYYGDHLLVKEDGSGVLQFGGDHTCELLTEEGFCSLVLKHGVGAIGNVCDSYPRFATIYGGLQEFHLSNGCEGVLRYFLKMEEPLSFVEEEADRLCLAQEFTVPGIMEEVRNYMIDLMQFRDFPLWVRMYLVKNIAEEITKKGAPEEVLRQYQSPERLVKIYQSLMGTPENDSARLYMIRGLLDLYLPKAENKRSYLLHVEPLLPEITWLKQESMDVLVAEWRDFSGRMARWEVYFEHLAVNFVYTHIELMTNREWMADCIKAHMIQYVLTRGLLFLKWHRNKESFSEKELTLITAFWARMIEHGIIATTSFIRENRDNEWFSDGALITMIRS